jgi:hypothetical protein
VRNRNREKIIPKGDLMVVHQEKINQALSLYYSLPPHSEDPKLKVETDREVRVTASSSLPSSASTASLLTQRILNSRWRLTER